MFISEFFLSLPALPLRVVRELPCPAPLAPSSGGVAVVSEYGRGGQVLLYSRACLRCRFCPLVASWSRWSDLAGQIWLVLGFVFAAVQLRWQDLLQAAEVRRGISINKVSFSSLSALSLWRGAGWWWLDASDVLPRRKAFGRCSGAARLNKRYVCFLCIWSATARFLLPACRGGEGKEQSIGVACSFGGGWGRFHTAQVWRSLSVAQAWLPTQGSWRGISYDADVQHLIIGRAELLIEQDLISCTRFHLLDYMHGEDVPVVRVEPAAVDDNTFVTVPQIQQQGPLSLSSVKDLLYLQLNTPLPQVHTPDRPSGEPPAGHQLVWSAEALEDYSCGTFGSELSTDGRSPFGSFCSLHRLHYVLSSTCIWVVQPILALSCSNRESHDVL